MRVKGVLGPDQLAGVESGKLDRATRMVVESVCPAKRNSKARIAGTRIVARAASGKDIRQLFERQGALVSRVMRVAIGREARQVARARPVPPADDEQGIVGAAAPAGEDRRPGSVRGRKGAAVLALAAYACLAACTRNRDGRSRIQRKPCHGPPVYTAEER